MKKFINNKKQLKLKYKVYILKHNLFYITLKSLYTKYR